MDSKVIFYCPFCGGKNRITPKYKSTQITCGHCRRNFIVDTSKYTNVFQPEPKKKHSTLSAIIIIALIFVLGVALSNLSRCGFAAVKNKVEQVKKEEQTVDYTQYKVSNETLGTHVEDYYKSGSQEISRDELYYEAMQNESYDSTMFDGKALFERGYGMQHLNSRAGNGCDDLQGLICYMGCMYTRGGANQAEGTYVIEWSTDNSAEGSVWAVFAGTQEPALTDRPRDIIVNEP